MTNQEAIMIIGNIPINQLTVDKYYSIPQYQEAKTMAIEALENKKTGHWIRLIEDYPECDFEFKGCSVCRTHYPNFAIKQFRYCPNCGSKMKGE